MSKVKDGHPTKELATQYSISTKTIYNWISYTTVSSSTHLSRPEYHRLKRENDELKKIIGLLTLQIERGKKIEINRQCTNKSLAAAVLGIPRGSLSYRPLQVTKDEVLVGQIREIHQTDPAYGHRRVALALQINHKRAQRVMS